MWLALSDQDHQYWILVPFSPPLSPRVHEIENPSSPFNCISSLLAVLDLALGFSCLWGTRAACPVHSYSPVFPHSSLCISKAVKDGWGMGCCFPLCRPLLLLFSGRYPYQPLPSGIPKLSCCSTFPVWLLSERSSSARHLCHPGLPGWGSGFEWLSPISWQVAIVFQCFRLGWLHVPKHWHYLLCLFLVLLYTSIDQSQAMVCL